MLREKIKYLHATPNMRQNETSLTEIFVTFAISYCSTDTSLRFFSEHNKQLHLCIFNVLNKYQSLKVKIF